MKINKTFIVYLAISLGGQVFANGNFPGKVIGGILTGIGGIGMMISGDSMQAVGEEQYCSAGTHRAISGTYDCSHQTCSLWVSNGQTYYCHTYYSGAIENYVESCQWEDNGSTCTQWVTISQICNHYSCQNSNGTFSDFLKRKNQPRYDNSKYALIGTSAVAGIGILTLILSIFFPKTLPENNQPAV